MNQEICLKIKDLRLNKGLGATTIAKILQNDYPNENISFRGWESRVVRFIKKENLQTTVQDNETVTENNNLLNSSVECKSDGSYVYSGIIKIFENEEVTPKRIMQAHKLDPDKWEVISYKNNYWNQQTKDGKTLILYQSKITVKPRKFDNISEETVIEHFINKTKNHKYIDPEYIITERNPRMIEINICDLHLGKLAFDSVSGDVYNLKIAKKRFYSLINTEYKRAIDNKVEKILFVWSNDFFNTDGISNATTRGTPQQTAINWQNLFLEGVSMLVDAIELLSTLAPVKSFYIASNHSRQSDFYALCYLQAWFRDSRNVTIVNNQKSRYYERYGVILLGFSHSYYEKESNLYHLMSTECVDDWAETTYREFHLAHYHSEKVKDVGGVIYRWLPTMCGTDEYHYDKGYIGSVKRSYSFLYDKCIGLIQINCNIIQ